MPLLIIYTVAIFGLVAGWRNLDEKVRRPNLAKTRERVSLPTVSSVQRDRNTLAEYSTIGLPDDSRAYNARLRSAAEIATYSFPYD